MRALLKRLLLAVLNALEDRASAKRRAIEIRSGIEYTRWAQQTIGDQREGQSAYYAFDATPRLKKALRRELSPDTFARLKFEYDMDGQEVGYFLAEKHHANAA